VCIEEPAPDFDSGLKRYLQPASGIPEKAPNNIIAEKGTGTCLNWNTPFTGWPLKITDWQRH
jgi:hypothetical protein